MTTRERRSPHTQYNAIIAVRLASRQLRRSRKSKPPAPVHAGRCTHFAPTPPTTVPRRLHMPHRSAPPTAAALAPQVHAQVHASAAPALHQRRPPTVGMMCQPQQVERTPAHARAKTRTILYAHGTRLNCADEAHARRALCMHEPWYRFLPWYALPRKPPSPTLLPDSNACLRPYAPVTARAPQVLCGGRGQGAMAVSLIAPALIVVVQSAVASFSLERLGRRWLPRAEIASVIAIK